MDKNQFPNPMLVIPEEFKDDSSIKESFNSVNTYLDDVHGYIHTNINLNYDSSELLHSRAWILKIVSANILRSLYIRNAFVEAFNGRNTVNMYFPLKGWFETVGVLAAILDLLEQNLAQEEIFQKLESYALGNKGKSEFRVGTIEARSVATMIEKADKFLQKLVKKSSNPDNSSGSSFFTNFYDNASNPTHPCMDAYELVGEIMPKLGRWQAKLPQETSSLIIEMRGHYGGLLMSPVCIKSICHKIFSREKSNFSLIESEKYFK